MPVSDPGFDRPARPGVADLPPAGDARREELKRRHDELVQRAEELSAEMEREGIHPDSFKIDREVAQHFTMDGELAFDNPQSEYKYSWVYRDPYNKFGGRFVHVMQADGWEIVRGDMPEASDKRSVTGERWIADCLLMRIRCDQHFVLEQRRRAQRRAREEGIAADLQDMADKRGIKVHIGELPSAVGARMAQASESGSAGRRDAATKRAMAAKLATNRLDRDIRAGTVPGMEVRR